MGKATQRGWCPVYNLEGFSFSILLLKKADKLEKTSGFLASELFLCHFSAIKTELQTSNDALVLESAKLAGLEKKVETIRDHITHRVAYYAICTD